jgi:nucleoid-associated protein YgaU
VAKAVTVVTGDSFWAIATQVATTRFGGSPSAAEVTSVWHALITANSNRLIQPGNPNLIYPGQVFVVPPPP